MIDTKYLQLVLAIDRCGSLGKASKELNLTPSALSHQLRNLESSLGIKLFHRTGNQLLFTEAGLALKERAGAILSELDDLQAKMVEIQADQERRYVHGYSQREAQRLQDQAATVAEYLHYDSIWEGGTHILEVGCGVGAQTEIIATQNPTCQFTSIDISGESIVRAKKRLQERGIENVQLEELDVYELPKRSVSYDHIFVCFLLEHLTNPQEVLAVLYRVLKPGGTITVIEGDHGSTFFYPDDPYARKLVRSQVALQERRGGDANIGRRLYPLLTSAKFNRVQVSPRQIYVDRSRGALVQGFIEDTFTAMIAGMGTAMIAEGLVTKEELERGLAGLRRTEEADGVFSYTFFKGVGQKSIG
ncbi:MAG: methyltransferase [Bacteroidota bacterium]